MRSSVFFLLLSLLALAGTTDAEAAAASYSDVLNDARPFIEYPVRMTQENSTLTADMTAREDGDLDTVLYLIDEDGLILAENDDREEGDTNSLLSVAHLKPGAYRVVASRLDAEDGETSGTFDLSISIGPAALQLVSYDVSDEALQALGYPAISPDPVAEWTILAFYGADTNLEDAILNDLDEFEMAGGSNEHVRVVVLMDRSPEYDTSNDDWTDVRVFEVQRDVTGDHLTAYPPRIDSVPIADLGELNTGDGTALAQFLAWGVQQYPAHHYAIAIGSHGSGWQGLSVDYSEESTVVGHDSPIISIPQLKVAFEEARKIAGVAKFDLLINDACLMSSVEYHTAMAPYFRLSLASPEIVVNPALDMTVLTTTLQSLTDPDETQLETLGTELVDKYISEDIHKRADTGTEYYTGALTNLEKYDPVTASVEAFAALVSSDPMAYVDTLGRARANTYTYTAFSGFNTLVDVGHFMEQVIIASHDVALMGAAQNVLEALEEARIHGSAGEAAAKWSYYYNIYFPAKAKDFELRYLDETTLPKWGRMLKTYFQLVKPNMWEQEDSVLVYHPPTAPKVTITQVYPTISSPNNPPTIRMEVEGRRIAKGSFTVDAVQADGTSYRLFNTDILTEITIGDTVNYVNQWRSGVDQSTFSWLPMTLTTVTDGTTTAYELLIKSGDMAILEGRYREAGSDDWHDVAVMFSLTTGNVARVMNRAKGTDALAEINPSDGAEFQAYRQMVVSNGTTKIEPGTLYHWNSDLSWKEETAPAGTYQLGFLVETYSGLSEFDSATIEVTDNEAGGLPLGYSELDLGVTFQYPEGWTTPFDTGTQIVTNAPDNQQSTMISYFTAPEENLWKIAEDFQIMNEVQAENAGEMVSFGDQLGVQFNYTVTRAGQPWYGRGLALYRLTPDRDGTGLVFSAETRDPSTLDALYTQFISHTQVFDAMALAQADTGLWQYRFFLPDIAHPVPIAWNSSPTPEIGEWMVFTAPDSLNTTAAVTYYDSTEPQLIFDNLRDHLPAGQRLREYENATRHWFVAEYRNNGMMGRLYVSLIENQVFALRFDTPDDDTALDYIRNVFEPMVDGFAPLNNVQYALGGINPVTLKAVMGRAALACDEINPNDACYGEGSVVVETITPVEEAAGFKGVGDTLQVPVLKELGVGLTQDLKDSFDSLSIAVINAIVPQEDSKTNTASSIRMGVFGGVVIGQPIEEDAAGGDQ